MSICHINLDTSKLRAALEKASAELESNSELMRRLCARPFTLNLPPVDPGELRASTYTRDTRPLHHNCRSVVMPIEPDYIEAEYTVLPLESDEDSACMLLP